MAKKKEKITMQEVCKYCGQIQFVEVDEDASVQEKLEAAIMKCDCEDAERYKKMDVRRKKAAAFFMDIEKDEKIRSLLLKAVDTVALVGSVAAVDIKLDSGKRYHIGFNSKGSLVTGCKVTKEKKEEN